MGEALTNSGEPANDTNRQAVRGQLEWDATDALNLRLIVGAVQEDDKQGNVRYLHRPGGASGHVRCCQPGGRPA